MNEIRMVGHVGHIWALCASLFSIFKETYHFTSYSEELQVTNITLSCTGFELGTYGFQVSIAVNWAIVIGMEIARKDGLKDG